MSDENDDRTEPGCPPERCCCGTQVKAPPRSIRRRVSCKIANSFPEEHERIRTTRRARLNRNDRVPLQRKEQRDPESRLCDALQDRTILRQAPAARAAPVRLAGCEARQRLCAPVENTNHTLILRAGSAAGVAPAFDCTGTQGASRTYVGLLQGRGTGDRVAAAGRLLKDFAVLKGARDDSHDST